MSFNPAHVRLGSNEAAEAIPRHSTITNLHIEVHLPRLAPN
jgi:hypothetical protein